MIVINNNLPRKGDRRESEGPRNRSPRTELQWTLAFQSDLIDQDKISENIRWYFAQILLWWQTYVETIALYDLWRRVIQIVMSLIVLVPFEPLKKRFQKWILLLLKLQTYSMNTIKIARFARAIFVGPEVTLSFDRSLDGECRFVVVHSFPCLRFELRFSLRLKQSILLC